MRSTILNAIAQINRQLFPNSRWWTVFAPCKHHRLRTHAGLGRTMIAEYKSPLRVGNPRFSIFVSTSEDPRAPNTSLIVANTQLEHRQMSFAPYL